MIGFMIGFILGVLGGTVVIAAVVVGRYES